MNEETPPPTELPQPASSPDAVEPAAGRAAVRQARKAQTRKRIARREACFELLSAGYSHETIARRLKVSVTSVRRDVARAIDQRRLDAPERYVHFQVDRLIRALRAMDDLVERGDTKAVRPYLHLVGALDRYHGIDVRYARDSTRLPRAAAAWQPLVLSAPAELSAKSSESDTQAPEKAHA